MQTKVATAAPILSFLRISAPEYSGIEEAVTFRECFIMLYSKGQEERIQRGTKQNFKESGRARRGLGGQNVLESFQKPVSASSWWQ